MSFLTKNDVPMKKKYHSWCRALTYHNYCILTKNTQCIAFAYVTVDFIVESGQTFCYDILCHSVCNGTGKNILNGKLILSKVLCLTIGGQLMRLLFYTIQLCGIMFQSNF